MIDKKFVLTVLAVLIWMTGWATYGCLKIAYTPGQPELTLRCIAYVDPAGYLRGRQGLWTDKAYKKYVGDLFTYSYSGVCTNQGPPRRVVCHVGGQAMWEDECLRKIHLQSQL